MVATKESTSENQRQRDLSITGATESRHSPFAVAVLWEAFMPRPMPPHLRHIADAPMQTRR